VLNQAPPPRLCNSKTNWDYFCHHISTNLTLHVPLKPDSQTEDADQYFNDIIPWAGWNATPETTYTPSSYTCPIFIKQKLAEKKKDFGENGNVPGHQRAKNYSTEQRKTSNNSYITTKITAFKSSYMVSHPQLPMTTPVENY
jgi:hypothetical protein